jgi:amino acid transporter
MSGNNAGQVLNGSRMLFALAEQRQLPAWLGRVHPRFRTPVNAIACTSSIALILALSGSLTAVASVSALARLLMYAGTAAATLRLRSATAAALDVKPAGFVTPFGAAIPLVAIVVCAGIAAGATRDQLLWGCAALVAGATLFLITKSLKSEG